MMKTHQTQHIPETEVAQSNKLTTWDVSYLKPKSVNTWFGVPYHEYIKAENESQACQLIQERFPGCHIMSVTTARPSFVGLLKERTAS
jgi:hypothetical protein